MPPHEHRHLLQRSKARWVEVQTGPHDLLFNDFPQESIDQWHQRMDVEQ